MKVFYLFLLFYSFSQVVHSFHGLNSKFRRATLVRRALESDWLEILDAVTTDLAKLGPIIPVAVAALAFNLQEKSLSKDIKATNDLLKANNDLLSKDIKATNDLLSKDIKANNDLLSKDIKATNEYIKTSNEKVSDNISRLEKVVSDLKNPSS